jgi:hypothetical protein
VGDDRWWRARAQSCKHGSRQSETEEPGTLLAMDRCAKVGKPSSFAFSCRSSLQVDGATTSHYNVNAAASERTRHGTKTTAVFRGELSHSVRSMMGPLSMSPSEKLEARVRNARYISSRSALHVPGPCFNIITTCCDLCRQITKAENTVCTPPQRQRSPAQRMSRADR